MDKDIIDAEATIKELLYAMRRKYQTKRVKITATADRFYGREAIINGITVIGSDIVFCCMVLRADDSNQFLNTCGDSRRYRKFNEFEVL